LADASDRGITDRQRGQSGDTQMAERIVIVGLKRHREPDGD
jgi:hypothetical protein